MLPMKKADYLARAIACSYGYSRGDERKSPTRQISVTFGIVELGDSHADDPNDFAWTGDRITWIGHFTDKTIDRTLESLDICGWKGDDLEELKSEDFDRIAELMPAVVSLACGPNTWDGKTTLRVDWVNKPGAGKFKFKDEMPDEDLRSYAAQMKRAIAQRRAGATVGVKSAPQPRSGGNPNGSPRGQDRHPNAPDDIDDLPF